MDTKSKLQADVKDAASVHEQDFPPIPEGIGRDKLLDYYFQMVLIRRLEEKTAEMYQKARIGGYCHLNLGEEATVVGLCEGLEPGDYVYTNYREHGYAVGRGISPGVVMAELFGKETGCSRGRGGSMHLFDIEHHFMGGYAIVGGQIPLATGAAFAIAYRGSSEIVVCQMGDGTTNTGAFHESLNLAKIYHLPIVYFVVNNLYGMGLRVEQGSSVSELYRKACAYDMQSWRVDGNDVLAVQNVVHQAATLARERHEPSLVEAVSFRFRGHSVVDPDRYRDKAEVQKGREYDPITAFTARLTAASLLDENGKFEIEERVQHEVDAAVTFAEESPYASVEDFMHNLDEYVYAPDEASVKGT
ncbi:MAG: pyruvate dehydrogenase (acetyl-transferring) E1 component subunit alpha [Ktedonobacteraceae bacterium]